MADRKLKSVTFEACGATHQLRASNGALRAIEDHFDSSIDDLDERRLGVATVMVQKMLMRERPYEIEEVDGIIDEIGYNRLGELINEAFASAVPEGALGKSKVSAKKRKGSTGRH